MIKLGKKICRSWDDVPLVMSRRHVIKLIGMDTPHDLTKQVEAGFIYRSGKPIAGAFKYPRSTVRRFCEENGCDPFDNLRPPEGKQR
ncbi:MAG: hypothetical protein KKE29_12855 [Proteobacteria bacterium]|nr:hypothetical protein [Pseudomonadota bacterium]MBU4574662.1 hypothetical protein [Pseudomonadota bacterium]MBU4599077.1 hypothetical protein [Pseudomonadota bacterium]MBV1714870.1 hypothetical protein [Desulfarculus sp.]